MDKNAIFLGIINSFEEYIEINKDILQEDIELREDAIYLDLKRKSR